MSRHLTAIIVFFLCLGCMSARAGRDDRGVATLKPEHPHLAKGGMQAGGSASFSMHGNDGYRFLVTDGVTSNGFNISARPYFLYAFADDFAVGGSIVYRRNMIDAAAAGISVSDLKFNVEDLYSIGNSWGFDAFVRKYLVLGTTGRFALFADMGIDMMFSQSRISDKRDGQIIGTWQSGWRAGIGVKPGVSFFLTDSFSIQAGVGLFNIGFGNTRQVHNQVASGSRGGFGISYAVDLLALNIGVSFSF